LDCIRDLSGTHRLEFKKQLRLVGLRMRTLKRKTPALPFFSLLFLARLFIGLIIHLSILALLLCAATGHIVEVADSSSLKKKRPATRSSAKRSFASAHKKRKITAVPKEKELSKTDRAELVKDKALVNWYRKHSHDHPYVVTYAIDTCEFMFLVC
jgi:hypothetical protein